MPQLQQQLKRVVIVPGQAPVIEEYEAVTGTEAEAVAVQQANDAAWSANVAEISDLAANVATAVQWLNQIESAAAADKSVALANLADVQAAVRRAATAIERLAIIQRRVLKLVARHLAATPANE